MSFYKMGGHEERCLWLVQPKPIRTHHSRPTPQGYLISGSLIYGPSSSLSMPPWERRHAVANIPRWGRNAELATETDFQVWEHAHNVNHDHAQHHLLQWDCIPQEVEFT